jgi:hypothetical protein
MMKDTLDDPGRFGPGKTDLAMNDVRKVGARQGPGVCPPDGSRVGHFFSLPPRLLKSIVQLGLSCKSTMRRNTLHAHSAFT